MPLDYLLSVLRDPSATPARRDRAAIAAAQYCHRREVHHRRGKKDAETAAAKTAGAGTDWAGDLEWQRQ
jgi:hypothetical protein